MNEKNFCPKALAKLKAIQEHYRNTKPTPVPRERISVFGKPASHVSPRVQRIRDLQAGKRIGKPASRPTMVWRDAEPTQRSVNQVNGENSTTGGSGDFMEDFRKACDAAADAMEKKS